MSALTFSDPPLRPTAREYARHALIVVAFNTALWLLDMARATHVPWDVLLVYNQAIGLVIWAIVDFGRVALAAPGRQWPSPARAIALVAVGVAGGWLIGSALGDAYSGRSMWAHLTASARQVVGTLVFTIGAALVATYFFWSRGRDAEQRERLAAAERDLTLARLALLQSQLEPHMLFNTLANLRVLIALDPPRAQAMLDRLIAFLRATLTASRASTHALATEFERLDDYLSLMAVRMGPRLQARLDLPADLREVAVPTLLLQPLVENAIRHGLEPEVEGGRIEVFARRDGEALVLAVRDTGVGLGEAPATEGTRFGLRQVRERLQRLFGERASLAVEPVRDAEGGTLACIRLPWPGEPLPGSPA